MSVDHQPDEAEVQASESTGRGLRRTLFVVIAVALALIVGAGGWALGHHSASNDKPSAASVDAGFARDMSTHHQQAVTMSIFERKYTTDPALALLAYDIEDEQAFEMGQMQGWLDSWGLSRQSKIAAMAWMGTPIPAGELMPGMATAAQMNELKSMTGGKAEDILFLQLMIRHHQGGVKMAQYALTHAKESYVRSLASAMVSNQNAEIIQMQQKLLQLGGRPLPSP